MRSSPARTRSRVAAGGNLTRLWTPVPITPIVRVVSKQALYGTAVVILLISWAHGAESGILATPILGAAIKAATSKAPAGKECFPAGAAMLGSALLG